MRHRLKRSALCIFVQGTQGKSQASWEVSENPSSRWLAWSHRPLDSEEKLSGKVSSSEATLPVHGHVDIYEQTIRIEDACDSQNQTVGPQTRV